VPARHPLPGAELAGLARCRGPAPELVGLARGACGPGAELVGLAQRPRPGVELARPAGRRGLGSGARRATTHPRSGESGIQS
jgi:hypothetical protein